MYDYRMSGNGGKGGNLSVRWSAFYLTLLLTGFFSFFVPMTASAESLIPRLPAGGEPLGWTQEEDGRWRYLLRDGSPVAGGWIKDGEGWYYFDSNGIMAADTDLEIMGHSYHFEESGAWREAPPADPLFVHLPEGYLLQDRQGQPAVYEHPWAGIRIKLPEQAVVKTAGELRTLSAFDYIPSYYDFLAVIPGQGLIGVVIQYNSDPQEKILSDDLHVFSNFWGQYNFKPTAPQLASVAGYEFQKIVCSLPADYSMDVYMRKQDSKVLYLLAIYPRGKNEAAGQLTGSVLNISLRLE